LKLDRPTKERLLAEIDERVRVEEQLRAANRTLRTVNRCNEALVRATEEIELVRAICRILVEDGGMRMAWVGYREENAPWRRIAHAGFDDGYLDQIDVGSTDPPTVNGPTAVAIRTGEPFLTDDIATDPRFRHWRDEALRRGYASSLSLPLKSEGTAFGALTLYADRPNAFDEQTRSHFAELANDLAYGVMAIRTRADRARVEEQLRAANRTLRTVNRCNEALVRATEEIELGEAICRILVEDGGMRMAWVGYREENAARTIRPIAHAGFEDGYLDSINWADARTAQGPAGVAIRTSDLCWIDDIATDPRFRQWRDEALKRGYRTALALPLKSNGTVFGALILYAGRPHAFDEQTRSHFTDLANDLAYGVMAIRTRVERARVEAELRRIEAYLEEGQRLTHTGSWAWNVATRESIYWSAENYRLFGLDPEKDAESFETALQKILPEDRANLVKILDAAIREKKDFEVDWRIPGPDGALRFLHSVGHPVVDKDGEVVEFVGTSVDVTEQHVASMALERENAKRRRAEDELRRSEAFLAEGQRISRTGSWAWNVATGEVSWSDEHFRIFGLDPKTATPSYTAGMERIHSEDRAAVEDMLQKAVRDSSDFQSDFRIVTPDGATKYVHSLGRVAANGAEFIGAVMDVTERRLAEEALRSALADLERASRLSTMGQLTASIAHEINQPLAAIITYADACLLWLEADQPNLEEARQAAARIVRNGHRAGDIIKSIRALTRKSSPEMVSLDINDVIREVIVLMGAEFRRHGVRVETLLSSNLDSVVGDRVQLQQVVLNLIMNGVEAMTDSVHGRRRLQVRSANAESGGVLVAVEDSGPGLDPAQTGRLFEAFFTTKPQGMGIGLSICRSIIDAHGGRLWASPNLPNGAVFQFTLPAAGRPD
jgi:signal transduction histidine kinase/GAF domain-containing protein